MLTLTLLCALLRVRVRSRTNLRAAVQQQVDGVHTASLSTTSLSKSWSLPPSDALLFSAWFGTRQQRASKHHPRERVPTGLLGEEGAVLPSTGGDLLQGALFRRIQWDMTAGATAVGLLARLFCVLVVAEVKQVR